MQSLERVLRAVGKLPLDECERDVGRHRPADVRTMEHAAIAKLRPADGHVAPASVFAPADERGARCRHAQALPRGRVPHRDRSLARAGRAGKQPDRQQPHTSATMPTHLSPPVLARPLSPDRTRPWCRKNRVLREVCRGFLRDRSTIAYRSYCRRRRMRLSPTRRVTLAPSRCSSKACTMRRLAPSSSRTCASVTSPCRSHSSTTRSRASS